MKRRAQILLTLSVYCFVFLPLWMGMGEGVACAADEVELPDLAGQGKPPAGGGSRELIQKGVAAYEQMEFTAATAALQSALARPGNTPEDLAAIHKYMAFVQIAQQNQEQGRREFIEALKQDPGLRLDPKTISPKIIGVFEEARKEFDAYLVRTDREPPVIRLKPLTGKQPFGRNVEIEASIRDNYRITSAEVCYRNKGDQTFASVPMTELKPGVYRGTIFPKAIAGKELEYYVMAQDAAGNTTYEGTAQAPLKVAIADNPSGKPWYKKWWVWTLVGVAVAGGGAAAGIAMGSGGGSSPQQQRPTPTTASVTIVVPAIP